MNVFFFEAHPDDIEISCLGAYFLHQARGDKVTHICASECDDLERNKYLRYEVEKVMEILDPDPPLVRFNLPNRELDHPDVKRELRGRLEALRRWKPDIIYCPSLKDIHQDHSSLAEEVIRVFRQHTILMYENNYSTPKFNPNYYIPLDRETMDKKLEVLDLFKSQDEKKLKKLARSMARNRGNEIQQPYAEAFEVWKVVQSL